MRVCPKIAQEQEILTPSSAIDTYTFVQQNWGTLTSGSEAAMRLDDLKSDQAFQQSLAAENIWLKISEAKNDLKPVPDSMTSYTDTGYQRANRRSLGTISLQTKKLLSQYPDTAFTQLAIETCRLLHIPTNEHEKKAEQLLSSLCARASAYEKYVVPNLLC